MVGMGAADDLSVENRNAIVASPVKRIGSLPEKVGIPYQPVCRCDELIPASFILADAKLPRAFGAEI
jgi:hypothetical protein